MYYSGFYAGDRHHSERGILAVKTASWNGYWIFERTCFKPTGHKNRQGKTGQMTICSVNLPVPSHNCPEATEWNWLFFAGSFSCWSWQHKRFACFQKPENKACNSQTFNAQRLATKRADSQSSKDLFHPSLKQFIFLCQLWLESFSHKNLEIFHDRDCAKNK